MLCHQPEQARRHIVLKNECVTHPFLYVRLTNPDPLIVVKMVRPNVDQRAFFINTKKKQSLIGRPVAEGAVSIHQQMHVMRSPQLLLLTTSLLVNLVGAFISPTVGLLGSSSRGASRCPWRLESRGCEEARRQQAVLLRVAATTAIVPPEAAWTENDDTNNNDPRVGVLLLNLGGPETGDDVEGKSGSGSAIY
jgi:hypothetical protein